ncbi:hypothetical protein [Vibrio cholerae]|uniref:hypothetical protein n=1 Tax=Vibrio cholerae TaxID=666 RepID=UPI000E6C6759|nr:hypothetical protein [Vibrio cholerae]NOF33108.1 hypothetical protein [Vibrio cholerae]RJK82850.1 hypothetical protein CHN45_17210 [Vibrio cholerae]
MQVHNYTQSTLDSTSYSTSLNKAQNNSSLSVLQKAATSAEMLNGVLDASSFSLEDLKQVIAGQQSIVKVLQSRNREEQITQTLANSINHNAASIEYIQGWTNGGVAMFNSALTFQYNNLLSQGTNGILKEDLFQIALLDIMVNSSKYGVKYSQLYQNNSDAFAHLLESIGSSSHSLHEHDWNTPSKISDRVTQLYNQILALKPFPQDSLLGNVINKLETEGGINTFASEILNNYSSAEGNYTLVSPGPVKYSTMLSLYILSVVLEKKPDLSQSVVEDILSGDKNKIDDFIKATFGSITNTNPKIDYDGFLFLAEHTTWQIQVNNINSFNSVIPGVSANQSILLNLGIIQIYNNGTTPPNGAQVDWSGNGIDIPQLISVYTKFPPRDLDENDIKELNRLGDETRLIMETLKYWISILRDSKISVARNI